MGKKSLAGHPFLKGSRRGSNGRSNRCSDKGFTKWKEGDPEGMAFESSCGSCDSRENWCIKKFWFLKDVGRSACPDPKKFNEIKGKRL